LSKLGRCKLLDSTACFLRQDVQQSAEKKHLRSHGWRQIWANGTSILDEKFEVQASLNKSAVKLELKLFAGKLPVNHPFQSID
jgi:hypothetical protein